MVLPVQSLDPGKRGLCFGSYTLEDPNWALLQLYPSPVTGPVVGLKGSHPTLVYISFHPTLPSKPCSGYPGSLKSLPTWPQACFQGLCGPLPWVCPLVDGSNYQCGHPQAQEVAMGLCTECGQSMERWVCAQGSLRVQDGARSGKKKDIELLGIKILKSTLIFHVIMMVYMCQVRRIDHVLVNSFISLIDSFLIFRHMLCGPPFVLLFQAHRCVGKV